MRTTVGLLLLCLPLVAAWQDPEPAKPGKPAASAQGPAAKNEAAKHAVPGRPARHPLEGVYRLTGRVIDGVADRKPSKGYLAITSRHLLLSLASTGPNRKHPLVHAGVREWRPAEQGMRTTARLEYYTDSGGDLHFVKDGDQEVRKIQKMMGGLRVLQGDRTWLEFERIE